MVGLARSRAPPWRGGTRSRMAFRLSETSSWLQRDAIGMREDALGRPSSPHVNDRGRAFSRSNIRRNAGRNLDLQCCPGRAGQQVAMTRPVLGDDVLDAGPRRASSVPGSPSRLGGTHASTRPRIRDQFSATCTGDRPAQHLKREPSAGGCGPSIALDVFRTRFFFCSRSDLVLFLLPRDPREAPRAAPVQADRRRSFAL